MELVRQSESSTPLAATPSIATETTPQADWPRVFYALGPGNVVDSYRKWSAGQDCNSETSLTFSGQFFDFCRARGVRAYAVSSHPDCEVFRDGAFTVENRPKPLANPSGVFFHLNQIWYGLSIIASALRFKADVLVVDSGTTHWFALSLLRLTRIRVVASLHNSYWASGFVPGGTVKRAIRASTAGSGATRPTRPSVSRPSASGKSKRSLTAETGRSSNTAANSARPILHRSLLRRRTNEVRFKCSSRDGSSERRGSSTS